MSRYTTRKAGSAGRLATLERKASRTAKYSVAPITLWDVTA